MNIIIALLIFSIVVVIHELGHFLLAKNNGIAVTEFSIGMGPRIVTLVKTAEGLRGKLFASANECDARKEWEGRTKYSIKLLPIGGSCMMLGEEEECEQVNAFNNKSIYARISVIIAGPLFNFILAFILSVILVSIGGYDRPMVTSVEDGMPMSDAGIQVGDQITRINSTKINLDREIGTYIQFNPLREEAMNITYIRDGKKDTVTVTPVKTTGENGTEAYRLGFGFGSERVKGNVWQTLKYSTYEVKYWIVTTIKSLGQLIIGKISKDELAGPVGIVNMVGDVIETTKPLGISAVLLTLINFCILLSANLGVMNLIPIPALDGGRLLFLFVEWLRGKPANREMEGWINLAGFVALMVLMVFVMYNDIMRIIQLKG